MVVFTFSVFGLKYFFWANLVQKNQNCQFKFKFWYLDQLEYVAFNGAVHFFHF